jgi:4-alpha-glucanotransferase
MNRRGSGILLHITSLPSPYGIGDLGPQAHAFSEFLGRTRQRCWQVLPLNPTDPAFGNSPYSTVSAFAGNPLLISPDQLAEEGLLTREDLKERPSFEGGRCDYSRAIACKEVLLERAYQRFHGNRMGAELFESFCKDHSTWLEDFSLFDVVRRRLEGRIWNSWPIPLRDRHEDALRAVRTEYRDDLEKVKFLQYLFYKQWRLLKLDFNRRGILLGDVPIYVNFDSADVWSNPELFKLDGEKRPSFVSGVPPDYFSPTGQLWGNPVYSWDKLRETGFEWWIRRMAHQLQLFDAVRIDHFRGLVAYWEVPAGEKTALHGRWVEAPVQTFFAALFRRFHDLHIIAEDLGLITADVREVLRNLGFQGMKVLLFAFGDDNPMHPYLPHNYEKHCVAYTGTHDNNTVRGWFEKNASPQDKARLSRYLGKEVTPDEVHWEMIRLAMASVADTVIFPMQDVLGLGEEAEMNRPGTAWGNWEWRLQAGQITPAVTARLLEMTERYGRG